VIKNNNVVLVLGAGASAPYGFPLGEQLVERIKTLKDPDIQGFLKRAPDSTTDHVIQFQTDLKTSGWRSIDRSLGNDISRVKI
jgi:hypothetical protein